MTTTDPLPPPPPPPGDPGFSTIGPAQVTGTVELVSSIDGQWITVPLGNHGDTRVRVDTITHYWGTQTGGTRLHLISGADFECSLPVDEVDSLIAAGV